MKRRLTLIVFSILVALPAFASKDRPQRFDGSGGILHGGPPTSAKSATDSFLLMGPTGSGAPYVGDFETREKAIDPTDPFTGGWSSIDLTQVTNWHWNVNDFAWSDLAPVPGYVPINGSYSAWCGDETIASCDGALDPTGGYGHGWNDMLEFRGTVTDNSLSCTLTINGLAEIFSEPGYDRTFLRVEKSAFVFVEVNYWEGVESVAIDETVTYLAGEYMGAAADEVVVLFQFQSDGGWDDADCSFPSAGAIILDDLEITSDNGVSTGGVVDFEEGDFAGTPFQIRLPQGVGDFAKIWSNLPDLDPCATNPSRQVAFIDDGIVVPGTGGSYCQDWCYGPGGFIVTTTGGLAGPAHRIHNAIESPPMAWGDATHGGGLLSFDVYRHEDLSVDAPGIFYTWDVRSVNTGEPDDLVFAAWRNRYFIYYGGPDYLRVSQVVDDLLVPEPTHVQIQLAVYEYNGWGWGWYGNDGYPAPYFDNVRFETYSLRGPHLGIREIDLAQDAFPAGGTIGMGDPGALGVRFDMAQDISPPSHNYPTFGDSIVFDCTVTAPDVVLDGLPRLVYKVKTNPVFDAFRTSALPTEGEVDCPVVVGHSGVEIPGRYFGDLDDEGFLFPGDIVHYFIRATDRDTVTDELQVALLPADTTGFGDFEDPMAYDPSFTMRCLPSISDLAGTQPPILFWNDFADRGGRDEWHTSLRTLGYDMGVDFDIYYTNGPSSGVGNGLGGTATALQLAGYETLLYTGGDLSINTISNGDLASDSGPDAELLMAWLDTGDKHAFLTGDDLASDLAAAGPATSSFLAQYMKVALDDRDIRDLIDGQMTPRVLPDPALPTNPVFTSLDSWVAYGGCRTINTFDAVTAEGTGQRIAQFADASGVGGVYPYSAGTLATGVGTAGTSAVISLPYDFSFIHTDPQAGGKSAARLAARDAILQDVLMYFGLPGGPWDPADTPAIVDRFTTSHHPNPFNPTTRISYTVALPGHLEVKIYDLRGRLVRTLVDGTVNTSGFVDWRGDDDRGASVASGVYFYEARLGGEATTGKMALIR